MIERSRAIVLGAVQGPTELLPVSSSAHLTLIPWLAGWDPDDRDPELDNSFGVALHAGAAAALLIGQRRVIAEELGTFDARKAGVVALSFLPPAILGVAFERPIERRLGGPLATAIGLLAGAAAMFVADRRPQLRDRGRATAADGLALGLAQAAALAPGVSRNGATLSAARWRGFTRRAVEHALPHGRPAGDRRGRGPQGNATARDEGFRARHAPDSPRAPPPPSPRRSPRRR